MSLRLTIEGAVASLLIDRADKRNAFNMAMWQAAPALLAEAAGNPAVRLLVVRSAASGGAFCAGADIAELLRINDFIGEIEAKPAIFFGDIDAQKAHLRITLQPRLGDGLCITLKFSGKIRQFILRELTGSFLQGALIVGQLEVHDGLLKFLMIAIGADLRACCPPIKRRIFEKD